MQENIQKQQASAEAETTKHNGTVSALREELEAKIATLEKEVDEATTELSSEQEQTKAHKAKGFPDRITKKWLEAELLAKYKSDKGAAAKGGIAWFRRTTTRMSAPS